MQLTEKDIDTIRDYWKNKLNSADRSALEQRMASDPDFKDEVEMEGLLLRAVTSKGDAALALWIGQLHEAALPDQAPAQTDTPQPKSPKIWLLIPIFGLLLLLGGQFDWKQRKSGGQKQPNAMPNPDFQQPNEPYAQQPDSHKKGGASTNPAVPSTPESTFDNLGAAIRDTVQWNIIHQKRLDSLVARYCRPVASAQSWQNALCQRDFPTVIAHHQKTINNIGTDSLAALFFPKQVWMLSELADSPATAVQWLTALLKTPASLTEIKQSKSSLLARLFEANIRINNPLCREKAKKLLQNTKLQKHLRREWLMRQ